MRTPLKVAIGGAVVASLVIVLALTALGDAREAPDGDGGGADGSAGDPAAACLVGTPDCVDTPLPPDADEPVSHEPSDDPLVDPTVDPQVVEPNPAAVDLRARPFDTAAVADDGRTVVIDFWSGVEPCYVLGRVDVDLRPNAVRITLHEGHLPLDEDVACIDIAVMKRTIVTLDEPIGDRTIVDGVAG